MRINDRRGLLCLLVIAVIAILLGAVMMWFNRQPKVTPAGAGGSMQEQLSPRTNPKP